MSDLGDKLLEIKRQKDTYILPENIKKDVTVYGVTGTLESGSAQSEDVSVKFFDYDGTVVYSYSKSQFLALTELPANPSHSGLTAQGWNWNLVDAKSFVTKYDKLNIGQNYITDDGKTRVYITLVGLRLSPQVGLCVNGTVIIDWGDGSTSTVTGTSITTNVDTTHTYSQQGNYVITIQPQNNSKFSITGYSSEGGSYLVWGKTPKGDMEAERYYIGAYTNSINKIELGANIEQLNANAFYYMKSLETITIPNQLLVFGNNSFNSCKSLKFVTIPSGVTNIPENCFSFCESLITVALPKGISRIETYAFNSASSIEDIVIPEPVSYIGTYCFQSCYNLKSVTLPDTIVTLDDQVFANCGFETIKLYSGITTLKYGVFNQCLSLTHIELPDTITTFGTNMFQNCYSLQSVVLPSGLTSIPVQTFTRCFALKTVNIPNNVTSIGNSAFNDCRTLNNMAIPSNVNSLGTNVFSSCGRFKSMVLPDNITTLPNYCFYYNYCLNNLVLPNSLTSIGQMSLFGIDSITRLDIPASVTTIQNNAICGKSLSIISFEHHTTIPTIQSSSLSSLPGDCKIIVPANLITEWAETGNWSMYEEYLYTPDGRSYWEAMDDIVEEDE